jgi:hypothetical protein
MQPRLFFSIASLSLSALCLLAGCAQCDPDEFPTCDGNFLVQCSEAGEPEPPTLVRNDCGQTEMVCEGPGCTYAEQVCHETDDGAACVDPSLTPCVAGEPDICSSNQELLLTCDADFGFYIASVICADEGTSSTSTCIDGPPAVCE